MSFGYQKFSLCHLIKNVINMATCKGDVRRDNKLFLEDEPEEPIPAKIDCFKTLCIDM